MKRLFAVFSGAVIAAAFLGPGTVTTAGRAGSGYTYSLLWTLVFATAACFVLQEASGRLTVVSGLNLGEAVAHHFGGTGGRLIRWLAAGAIFVGCAAYEAGNILGGVAGAQLGVGLSRDALTWLSVGAAFVMLAIGSTRLIVVVLGGLVAVMGVAFLLTAVLLRPPLGEVASGLVVPQVPPSSSLLVLGLIGTTVVPYNLFLGSGIARGQKLGELRFGLAVAIGLGGLISMAVVVVGAALRGEFSYEALGAALGSELGGWAEGLFALGLFAAGFSSAVTAPLAAAVTARSVFADGQEDPAWKERSWRYRAVWLTVLATGAVFGLSGVRPVPVIVLAQALNGVLLPVAAVFLLVAVNDRQLVGARLNGAASNVAMSAAVAVTVLLGLRGVARALASGLGTTFPESWVLIACGAVIVLLAAPLYLSIRRLR